MAYRDAVGAPAEEHRERGEVEDAALRAGEPRQDAGTFLTEHVLHELGGATIVAGGPGGGGRSGKQVRSLQSSSSSGWAGKRSWPAPTGVCVVKTPFVRTASTSD